MATRDWASLGFTPTLSFALPNERQLAQSSQADASKGAEFKFNPTSLNAQLLASLGYTGQGLNDTAGSDYGFGAGPQWSDDARTWLANNGYTVGVAHDPGTSPGGRAEYYGLVDRNGNFVAGQDDPTMTMSDTLADQITPFALMAAPFAAQYAFGGAAGGAGGVGAAGSGAAGLGDLAGAISQGFGSGVGAAGVGAAGSSLGSLAGAGAGLVGIGDISNAISQGFGSGFGGAGVGAGGEIAAGSLLPVIPSVANLPDVPPEYTPQSIPNVPNNTFTEIPPTPGLTPQSNWFQDLVKPIGSAVKPIVDAVGGGSNLAALIGAGLGAASGGGSTTSSRDPWIAAQPLLKNILGDLETQRAKLATQPYTPQQTQQYQNAFAGLDQARSALPGLLNWGQNAMQYQSTVPSYQQLFGGGLLGGPTSQAGGAGGQVDDRMKALMARGRGLIG